MLESRDTLLKRKRELKRTILEIIRQERHKSIMICSHNTILGLKLNGKVVAVVDQKQDRNLVNTCNLNEHLCVPRYEPKLAKEWMKEELVVNLWDGPANDPDYLYSKCLLSERELRAIVKEEKEGFLESTNMMLKAYREHGIITGNELNKEEV